MGVLTSSIIICTRNRINDIISALKSIQQQTMLPNELIIIDSSDIKLIDNYQFAALFNQQQFPYTQLLYKHTKPGLTHQRNVGIAATKKDILYFFDDDVIIDKNYMQQMHQIFLKNPHYGGGMGSIINISKKKYLYCVGHFLRTIFFLQRDYSSGKFTLSGMPTHPYGTHTFKLVEALGGCCMAYRKAAIKNQKFDEKLYGYAYMEDCDFSRRISYKYSLFFNPAAKLCHYNSPLNRDAVIENKAMFTYNYSYLFFKNFYPRNKVKIIAYYWTIAGLFLEALVRGKKDHIQGYWLGLKQYHNKSKNKKLRQPKAEKSL